MWSLVHPAACVRKNSVHRNSALVRAIFRSFEAYSHTNITKLIVKMYRQCVPTVEDILPRMISCEYSYRLKAVASFTAEAGSISLRPIAVAIPPWSCRPDLAVVGSQCTPSILHPLHFHSSLPNIRGPTDAVPNIAFLILCTHSATCESSFLWQIVPPWILTD